MPDRPPRPVSLAALTVLEISPVAAVRIAADCGYSHVGLRAVAATPTEPHVPILTDTALSAELARALIDHGIGVLDVEIVRLTPAMDWPLMDRVLEFAARLAAPRLLVADNDPEPARCRDHLATLAERAAVFAVTPHLEFMPWTCAPTLDAARARIAGIANCRLLVDAFHLARSGGQPNDITPGDPDIGYIQLCDIAGPIPAMDEIMREARCDRLFPGDGEIDLASLLARLPGLPLSLEIPSDALRDLGCAALDRARMAIERTRALLARADACG